MNSMNFKRLPLDLRLDAKLSPEEEVPDCEHCGEGDLACLHVWKESVLQMENWREDHAMGVSRHLSRPEWVLWKWMRVDLPSL